MIRKCLQLAAAALLFTLPATATAGGDCSTLAVTTADNGDMTTNITFDVTGSAAASFSFIVVGDTLGDFSAVIGGTTLSLGLTPPFAILPLGVTDANGDLSTSFDIPAGLGDWNAQSLGIEFTPPSFGFCTSNVTSFSI